MVAYNQLTGSIPTDLAKLSELSYLNLGTSDILIDVVIRDSFSFVWRLSVHESTPNTFVGFSALFLLLSALKQHLTTVILAGLPCLPETLRASLGLVVSQAEPLVAITLEPVV